jgi:hypothetical protein
VTIDELRKLHEAVTEADRAALDASCFRLVERRYAARYKLNDAMRNALPALLDVVEAATRVRETVFDNARQACARADLDAALNALRRC